MTGDVTTPERGEGTKGRCHLLIRGGSIVDGTGKPAWAGDLAIDAGRIAALGDLGAWRSDEVVDATGLVLAPGFIDVHTHDDQAVIGSPDMAPKVSQGVTTVIAGNCGISLAPFRPGEAFPPPLELLGEPEDYAYPSLGAYRAALEARPAAVNLGLLTGHGMLRVEQLGAGYDRAATAAEIEVMAARLREALAEGSLGLSSGLDYPSSRAAPTAELLGMVTVLRDCPNALYVSHIRCESEEVLAALSEAFEIGRGGKVPTVISHHKCAGVENFGRSRETLAAIDAAAGGQKVGLDVYPYTASSTVLLPENVARSEDVLITHSKAVPEAAGRRLAEIAADWGCSQEEAIQRLRPAGAIYFQMADEDLERIMAYERTMIGSDGLPGTPHPHPRLWGTFPRVLGRYVREKGVLSLEEAVRRMTGLAADSFHLRERGYLRPGYHADLVLFDPAQISDRATFEAPCQAAVGVELVLVNGHPVWRQGATTGARPGQFLARAA